MPCDHFYKSCTPDECFMAEEAQTNCSRLRRRKQTARGWIEGGIHSMTQDRPTLKAYREVNTWFGGHPSARRNGDEFTNMLRDIQVVDQSLQSPSDNEERTRLNISVHHAGLVLPTSGHEAEGQI